MADGFVDPAYGERSLADVVPAVAAALGTPLGVPFTPTRLVLPPAAAYVVLLVDGLGQQLIERHRDHAPYLASMLTEPGTAGVPSTTATSLTSLGTGLATGGHGIVGFTSRVPETGKLLNSLTWDKHVDAVEYQPHETAFGALAAAGVAVTTVSKREFAKSGLTVAGQRGAEYIGADPIGERIAAAASCARHRPSLTYVYDGDLDWTGHRHGVDSPAWRQQLRMVDATADQLRESLPPDVRLLITADHGMVDVPDTDKVDIDHVPGMRAGIAMIGGEARFRHLYCEAGSVAGVVTRWREILGDRADVLTRDEAIDRGWFGAVESRVRPRFGDVIVACAGTTAIVSSEDFNYETRLIGMHGSLTGVEMEIPFLLS